MKRSALFQLMATALSCSFTLAQTGSTTPSRRITVRQGDCNYYSIPTGGKKSLNAVWFYENPFPALVKIKGHVTFYPERVDEIAEQFRT